ncbi:MAG: hypothetical protein ACRD0X_05860 [Thermoanaerobaculia bacterium]
MSRPPRIAPGVLAALVAAHLGLAAPAAAYIDPGSGSLYLQMLVAGLLGLGMTLKLYWRKLKRRFGHRRDEDQPPTP